jgi:large subunit ribosomal protein L1
MPKVATSFGKVLGPAGKMPNPKAGCVVPPNANLKPLANRLHKTLKITAKTMPMVQIAVGKEDAPDEEVIDNVMTVYDGVLHHVPSGLNNIRKIMMKLTMSKPIKLE